MYCECKSVFQLNQVMQLHSLIQPLVLPDCIVSHQCMCSTVHLQHAPPPPPPPPLHTHKDTISGFKKILLGELDHIPEIAFYMVGTVEEAVAKAEKLAQE